MASRFRYYLRVRYGECDAQKVVFNARYADYVDLGTIGVTARNRVRLASGQRHARLPAHEAHD